MDVPSIVFIQADNVESERTYLSLEIKEILIILKFYILTLHEAIVSWLLY